MWINYWLINYVQTGCSKTGLDSTLPVPILMVVLPEVRRRRQLKYQPEKGWRKFCMSLVSIALVPNYVTATKKYPTSSCRVYVGPISVPFYTVIWLWADRFPWKSIHKFCLHDGQRSHGSFRGRLSKLSIACSCKVAVNQPKSSKLSYITICSKSLITAKTLVIDDQLPLRRLAVIVIGPPCSIAPLLPV